MFFTKTSGGVLQLRFLHKVFQNSQLKKYNRNSAHDYNRKISVDILSHRYIQKQRPQVFYKKIVFKNFIKFIGKHLCQSLYLNKVAGLRPATVF